ncbi:MAG: trypsin-like serine protease [Ruminococcaceae bacterium]|nr:trypsin-like serine protease [Oscillospiraceae bacterium]
MNEFDNNNNNNQFDSDLNDYINKDEEPKRPEPEAPVNEPPKVQEQYRQYRPEPQQNGGYYGNGYPYYTYNAPNNSYGAPYGQGISYTPEAPKKKKKEKKGISAGAVAALCCITILLSTAGGFVGTYFAGKITGDRQPGISNIVGSDNISMDTPVVIYRDVDDVQTSVDKADGETLSFSSVAALVKDSVVEITTEYNVQSTWYNYVTQGAGSGVIISENGYIVTNAHVITGETSAVADNILVRLTTGEEFTATVIGYDTDADIAIIKIDATGLSAAVCGDSDTLVVGEELVVVGNPLGELGGTVTNGIVSATEREISVNGVKMQLVQTNAAVSPGNSGGGMFNMEGKLVGIINAKSSGTGVEGLGFAIPINDALSVTEQLMQYGYVRGKTYIGVGFEVVSSSNNFYFFYGIKPGVYVTSLVEGYNDTVLRAGDRVVAIDGKTISTVEEIKGIVTASSVGDVLKFQIEREGKLIEVEVTCYEKVPEKASENVKFDS